MRAEHLGACAMFVSAVTSAGQTVPPGFTVAFIGDQGLGPDAVAVLQLIEDQGADLVIHSGDFDYEDDPAAWDAQIDSVLGPAFPYIASIGNHDVARYCGPGGYQERLEARLNRLGIAWEGDLGVQATIRYQGLFITLTAPGIHGCGDATHDRFLREQFAADDSAWRISSWHKNQTLMQVGTKTDETGWDVYETARRAGAIIATGHEHSYSRTHLLRRCFVPSVAATSPTLTLARDNPFTPEDDGRTFVFVSGLGGRSIRDQFLNGPWWASIYTNDQGADHGALFGVFNVDGNPCQARFYFMDVAGNVADEFGVLTTIGPCGDGFFGNPPAAPSPSGFCAAAACPGDVNDDGFVNFEDASDLISRFGCCEDLGDCRGDLVANGVIEVLDLLEVLGGWGTCPGEPNPCPWDLDGDGEVDWIDLYLVYDAQGTCADPDQCPADFNADGEVDEIDVALLILRWGSCD